MGGDRLGSYDLVRRIATGGMAEIFLARRWCEGGFVREMAIKRLYPHLAQDDVQRRLFIDEARLMAALSHPAIPQVFELGRDGGTWYLSMELVEGVDVAALFDAARAQRKPIPIGAALAIMIQACQGLHHAHERRDLAGRPLRIVHRDVNPSNLMVSRDGHVKVMDFGVARTAAREDTVPGAVRGTLSYMAPEQIQGLPLDRRADVFALGAVLYELTTGERLFEGGDVQVMTRIVEQDVPPPSRRIASYPSDLEEIVMAALVRERGRRLPTAGRFALYLSEFAAREGLTVDARPLAAFLSRVTPPGREPESALALVPRREERPHLDLVVEHSETDRVWMPKEEPLPAIDDREVQDDLDLLSQPPPPLADRRETMNESAELEAGGAPFASRQDTQVELRRDMLWLHLEDGSDPEVDPEAGDA